MPIIPLAVPTLTMLVLLIVPGGLLAATLGLRGSTWLAAAAPISVALISTAALATAFVPVSWGLLPAAAVTAVGVAVALAVRLILRKLPGAADGWQGSWGGRDEWLSYFAIALAAGLIWFVFLRAWPAADAFTGGYDNFFHMGVIRSYLEQGQASPFVPHDFGDPAGPSFIYPTAWHQLAALLISTGVTNSIPVAQNALTLAVAGVVWPTSALFFIRSTFKSGPALLLGTGVLAAGFALFPYLPTTYGPIYPFMLGVSLLPFGLGLTMQALRLSESARLHWLLLATLGVLYLGATLMAHPNAFLGWLAISMALLVTVWLRQLWRAWRGKSSWPIALRLTGLTVVLIAVAVTIWLQVRPGLHWWEPPLTLPQAFGEFWLAGALERPAAVGAFLVVAAGLAVMARRPKYWYLLAPAGVLLVLWLAAASFANPDLRDFLTGGFYNDMARLGVLTVLGLLPLAALGLAQADDWLADAQLSTRKLVAVLTAGVVGLTYATQAQGNVREEGWLIAEGYRPAPDSPDLTPDELQMLADLPSYVSPDDIVIADTLTGASFMYGLDGLRPIQYHPKEGLTPAEQTLLQGFTDPAQRAEVCIAVDETSADFVLDFGDLLINMELAYNPAPGLMGLADSELVTLVHEVGDTRLYEITGCS